MEIRKVWRKIEDPLGYLVAIIFISFVIFIAVVADDPCFAADQLYTLFEYIQPCLQ